MPGGVDRRLIVPLIFVIEILSVFLRLISLTVRLWANLLAGHMLIAFMGGELGVLVGDQWVQWLLLPLGIAIFLFEAVLIAGLQAFIFAILTAIYLGERGLRATSNHTRSYRVNAVRPSSSAIFHPLYRGWSTPTTYGQKAGRAIALGVGAGGGAAGAGAGIGMRVRQASIQAKTRQPELRAGHRARSSGSGFALTEACFFYGLVGGFIAFFL